MAEDMEEQFIASLEEAFNELDESGSGTLGIEEFQDLLFACGNTASPDEAQAMFRSIDVDGSGGIDRNEFIEFMCGKKDDEGEEAMPKGIYDRKAKAAAAGAVIAGTPKNGTATPSFIFWSSSMPSALCHLCAPPPSAPPPAPPRRR
jgi:hypothetical protein